MSDDTPSNDCPARELAEVILDWTRAFCRDELGLDIALPAASPENPNRLHLRDVTAIVGLGGEANTFIAFSLDVALADHVAATMTAGIDVSDMDAESLREDATGELVNTIVGNATTDLEQKGRRISLTPPVVLFGQQRIYRNRDAVFRHISCETGCGGMDINLVGPQTLFDEQLNYVGSTR